MKVSWNYPLLRVTSLYLTGTEETHSYICISQTKLNYVYPEEYVDAIVKFLIVMLVYN